MSHQEVSGACGGPFGPARALFSASHVPDAESEGGGDEEEGENVLTNSLQHGLLERYSLKDDQ